MRFTDEQYDKAIAHLQEARTQLEPNGNGCHCCGGSGHQAFECGHNPLVAMAMCVGIAKSSDTLHDQIHEIEDRMDSEDVSGLFADWRESVHEHLHELAGHNTYMGSQTGPARVVLP